MRPHALIAVIAVLCASCPAVFAGEAAPPAESPDKLYIEGLSLFQNRNFEKAEKLFSKLMEIRPGHVPTIYMRGACRLSLGSYEAALADFDAVVKAMPKFAKGLAQRGKTLLCLGRYDESRKDLEEAVAMDPSDVGWKADHEQAKMLLRGSTEFGTGVAFPPISLVAPAPKGKEPPETGDALSTLAGIDRAGRAMSGEGAHRGTVLVFFQGMSSPVERSWLSDLNEFVPDFEQLGFTAAAVFPDAPEVLYELLEGKDLSLPLYSDRQGRSAWKLGILNTRRKDLGEPLPSIFVIDRSGRIVSRRTFLDPGRRDPVEKVLKDLAEKTKKDDSGRED